MNFFSILLKNNIMNYSMYFKICSYIPIINLFSLLLLVLQVYFVYGYMPTYSNPDPKEMVFTYFIFLTITFLLIFSFFVYPILIAIVIYKRDLKIKKIFMYIIMYVASLILLLVLYRLESLNLGNWILD